MAWANMHNAQSHGQRCLRWVLAVLLLGGAGLCGCGGGSDQADQGEAAADTAHSDPRTDTLRARLREINQSLEYADQDAQLYAQRAMVYYQLGKTDSALRDARRAVRYDSTNPARHHALGFYHYAQEQDREAISHYRKAADLGSENPETYHQLGNSLAVQGQYAQALTWYEKALNQAPERPVYHFAKAYALRELNREAEAIRTAEAALGRDSTFIKALDLLVDIYMKDRNDLMRAERYNNKILNKNAHHPVGAYNAGQLAFRRYLRAEQQAAEERYLQAAIRAYTKALRSSPQFGNAYYARGYAYQELGRAQKALSDYQMAQQHNPNDPRIYFQMGAVYEYFNDHTQAKQNYKKALQLKPHFPAARRALQELGGTPPSPQPDQAAAGRQKTDAPHPVPAPAN